MKTLRFFSTVCCLVLTFPCILAAQPKPMDWGKIPDFHLKMDSYPADTNASAVILAEYGTVEFQQDRSLIFEVHRRVKILTEKGFELGTVSLAFPRDGYRIRNIKGQTFIPDANGKATRYAMENSAVFEEKLDKEYTRIRFTLPNLQPGAIFEYRYELYIDSPVVLPSWQFQGSEPVFWSEYRIDIPPELGYMRATIGQSNFEIDEVQEVGRTDGTHRFQRMVMRDVPAIRDEPFITTLDDYRARVQFQLAEYRSEGIIKPFLESWPVLAKRLMEMDSFGRTLGKGSSIKEKATEIITGIESPLDRMIAIYDFVRSNIERIESSSIFLDQSLNDVLTKRKGSSTEMNLLYVALLKAVGIDAHPVLISSRSNGQIIDIYPILSQFDAVLSYARVDGKEYVMSPTNRFRPHTILPVDALNGKGWLVSDPGQRWIPITAQGKYQHQATVTARLDETGTLTGRLEAADAQYSAVFKRDDLSEETDRNKFYKESFFDENQEVTLDSVTIYNENEIDQALKSSCTFSIPNYAQMAGDFIYFNPFVTTRTSENPLKLPERKFPVDMAYPRDLVYNLIFQIPEGFVVQEVPHDMKATIKSGKAVFLRKITADDFTIRVQARLTFTDAVYPNSIYQDLKEFYNHVIATQAEQIVLKRAEAASEATGGAL